MWFVEADVKLVVEDDLGRHTAAFDFDVLVLHLIDEEFEALQLRQLTNREDMDLEIKGI